MAGMKLFAALVIVGALALPGVSSAAQTPPPTQDSVVLTGAPGLSKYGTIYDLNATSGPSGENPTGRVDFGDGFLHSQGPVTCLAVSGNTATINFLDEIGYFSGFILTVEVADNDPDAFIPYLLARAPTDCSPLPIDPSQGALSIGDITVTDAQPLPTSKDQCRNGGWRQFGFANQGQCVRSIT